MTPEQVHAFLAWVNQHDPRVETSPVNVEVWSRAIGSFDGQVLKDVMLDYFSRSGDKPAPSEIRKLATSQVERNQARQRALTATPDTRPSRSFADLRGRITASEVFMAKVREGRAERAAHFGEPTDADGEYTDIPGWHPSQDPYKAPSIHPRAMS